MIVPAFISPMPGQPEEPRVEVLRIGRLGPDRRGVAAVVVRDRCAQVADPLGHVAGEAVEGRRRPEGASSCSGSIAAIARGVEAADPAAAARSGPENAFWTVTCWSSAKPIRSASGSAAMSASASRSPVNGRWSGGTGRRHGRMVCVALRARRRLRISDAQPRSLCRHRPPARDPRRPPPGRRGRPARRAPDAPRARRRVEAVAGPDDGTPDDARGHRAPAASRSCRGSSTPTATSSARSRRAGVPGDDDLGRPGRVPVGVRNARVTVEAGFTTVRDVGTFRAFVDVALRDAIARGEVEGPRMQCAGAFITAPWGGGDVVGLAHDIRPARRPPVRRRAPRPTRCASASGGC